ncbi:MAG: Zn-ribbon domain-containing OB-fold protein [Candidatus Aenigmarchaeota archaeon]|nr:Zn-ribbon domain-containing OB-fold protein [Candidatus Aenigmarchaeota archaeon]
MGSVPMSWRLAKHRYSMVGTRCECGQVHFPPLDVCGCGRQVSEKFAFSGRGEVVSWTSIHVGPSGFERATPYNVALIKLEEGPVVSGIVVDKKVEIGQKVRAVFRRLHEDGRGGLISYGFKFEVV